MHGEMRFNLHHQIPQAFTRMIAGAHVMHIAKGALDGVGPRIVGRQKQQGEAWALSQPGVDGLCLMALIVIHHDVNPLALRGRIGVVEGRQERPEQRSGFARPTAVAQGTGRQLQRSREVVLRIAPRRHDGHLNAVRPPAGADFGSQVDRPFVSNHHGLAACALLKAVPDAGQARDAVGIVVCGHQCGAFPHPAALVEPTPPRLRRDREPPFAR
jgi:hypothetical protein